MHLAEQSAEVSEVIQFFGARPVEWVLDNIDVGPDCCFIHCTQMEPHEQSEVRRKQVPLKPVFARSPKQALETAFLMASTGRMAGGKIAIGSDLEYPTIEEELRGLEYSQRLRDRSRAAPGDINSINRTAYSKVAIAGGAEVSRSPYRPDCAGLLGDFDVPNQRERILCAKAIILSTVSFLPVTTILFKMFGPQADTFKCLWTSIGTVTRLSQPIVKQWPACERNYNHMKWPK